MTNCLDFGLDFLFAHPGGSVLVGFVIECIQGLHQFGSVIINARFIYNTRN